MKIYLAGKVNGRKWDLFTKDQIKTCPIIASDGGNHSEHAYGMAYYGWEYCADAYRDAVEGAFIAQVPACKQLIAYLDRNTSFGSIAEIAYFSAKGISSTVFIVDSSHFDEEDHFSAAERSMFDTYWFVCSFPGVKVEVCRDFDDAKERAQSLLWDFGYRPPVSYEEYLKSDRWQGLRKQALKDAGYKCRLCNKRAELHVHHRTYENKGTDQEILDLIVLCKDCHATYHDKGETA